jgi:hypothetical protein
MFAIASPLGVEVSTATSSVTRQLRHAASRPDCEGALTGHSGGWVYVQAACIPCPSPPY